MAEGRYEEAITGYIKAAEYLQAAIKYEKNPVRDRRACRGVGRADPPCTRRRSRSR